MPTRRQFLTTLGAGAVGSVALSTPATASHPERQPDHVTVAYDENWLKTYQPLLAFEGDGLDKLIGLYGLRATSPEYDTDVAVFWADYTNQQGWIGPDSHYGDTEPCYVFVDSDTGDVVEVRASVYHWLADSGSPPGLPLEDKRPRLGVIAPHHQYRAAREDENTVTVTLRNLVDAYDTWLANGMEQDVAVGAVLNPWLMQSRESWWGEGRLGYNFNGALVAFWARVGVGTVGTLEV
jgi:hypothetical protein